MPVLFIDPWFIGQRPELEGARAEVWNGAKRRVPFKRVLEATA
jgi:hypothetical protein